MATRKNNNLRTAESLLRYYDENSIYRQNEPIDEQADDTDNIKKLVTRSYLNTYDALYNKYSGTKNFNIDMLQNSIKLGEQDAYFALLEQNKNNTMASQFYDPQYYDYETMMLELYKGSADNTDKTLETRYKDVYNTQTGKWEQQNIGDMTERQYIQYQLDSAYAAKAEQLYREQEQMHKDNMSWWKKTWANIGAFAGELGEGFLGGLVGTLDLIIAPFVATGKTMFGDEKWHEWDDVFVNYYADSGLLAAEKEGVRTALDEYERKHTSFKDINGNNTWVGKYFGGMANSIGMMVPAIITTLATGGTAAPAWLGQLQFYTSVFSGNVYDNATNENLGGPAWAKILNAGIKTGVEAVIEVGLSKILGGTIQNNLLGITGRKLTAGAVAKGVGKMAAAKYFVKSAAQEGLEEFLQDFSTHLVNVGMDLYAEGKWGHKVGYENDGVNMQTLIDSFILGAMSSMFLGGFNAYVSSPISRKIKGNEIYIDTEKGTEKLGGMRALYYSSLVSDFREAVDKLKKNKFNAKKNLELAQEVYTAFSAFSQFYSSIGEERTKMAELVLKRLQNYEQDFERYGLSEEKRAEMSEEELLAHDVDIALKTGNDVNTFGQLRSFSFASIVERFFNDAVVDVSERAKVQVKKATEKVGEELKKNGVTEVKTVTDKDGTTYAKDSTIADIEKRLGENAKNKVDKIKDDYDWVFTVDGHIAVEEDGVLFVSESWLENYTEHEIYKFLEQQRVIKELSTNKDYTEFNKDLVAFAKEFTGKEIELEEAIMNFLTNENFHQAFILSHKGATIDKYRKFVVGYGAMTTALAHQKIDADKRLSDKTKMARANYAAQYFAQMKKTARKGIILALLNWNFKLQDLNASIMLDKPDRVWVNKQIAERKNKVEGRKSSYRRQTDELVELGRDDVVPLSTKDIELIHHYQRGTGTNDEQLMGLVILNLLDDRYIDDPSSATISAGTHLNYLNGHLQLPSAFMSKRKLTIEYNKLLERLRFYTIQPENVPQTLQSAYENFVSTAETLFKNTGEDINKRDGYLLTYKSALVNLFHELVNFEETVGIDIAPITSKTVSLPVQAFSGTPEGAHEIQYKADKIAEFEKMYGVSPSWLYTTPGVQLPNGNYMVPQMIRTTQLFKDTFVASKLSPRDFAIQEMEKLLGKEYMVVPNYFPVNLDEATAKTALPKYDFVIVKKIPAGELLVPDVEQKLQKGTEIFNALNVLSRDEINKIESEVGFGYVRELRQVEEDIFQYAIGTIDTNTGEFVDPVTGEVREYRNAPTLFNFLRRLKENTRSLSELLSVDIPRLKDWTVVVNPRLPELGITKISEKRIEIRLNDDLDTLVHEINHAIHAEYGITYGANPEALRNNEKLLRDVCEHYGLLVHFGARYLRAYENYELDGIDWSDFDSITNRLGTDFYSTIAFLAYNMNLGELFAREYTHSQKQVRGYTTVNYGGREFIVSPHNEKFPTPYRALDPRHYELIPRKDDPQKSQPIVISKKVDMPAPIDYQVTTNALGNSFIAVVRGRKVTEQGRDPRVHRNTFHSSFTGDVMQIVESLVRDDLPFLLKFNLSIDKILREPEYYLKDEILALMPEDKENAAFFAVKAYLEKNFESVSLDLDARTHEYIFVDDNAFDDLLNNRASVGNGKPADNSFAQAYTGKTVTLGEFYGKEKLRELGISPDIPVIIDASQDSEFIVTSDYPNGVVHLKIDGTENNATFFDELNHEFRHVMQQYHGFELGFTPDFKVSDAMLADVKAHVPEIFELEDLRTVMEKQLIKANRPHTEKDIDKFIVQNFVYFLTSGEIMAYGISAELLFGKPIYVTTERGKPTIFMPWYDAKSGEGRWITEFSGSKAIRDTSDTTKKTSRPKVKKIELATQIKQKQIPRYLAEGTNLKYYVKTGVETQLNPAMQEFVIATTGHENELPIELMSLIYDGKLNMQLFNQWFKEVELSEVNDFTFKLVNKYLFNNPLIESVAELERFMNLSIRYYWAIPLVLYERGMNINSFLAEKDVNDIVSLLTEVKKDPELMSAVEKKAADFTTFGKDKDGKPISFDLDSEDAGWVRLLAMQYFNGTVANVLYIAKKFRDKMVQSKYKGKGNISIESSADDGKGGKSRTVEEEISEANVFNESTDGYDIWSLAERSRTKTFEQMGAELYWLKEDELIKNFVSKLSENKRDRITYELKYFDDYKEEIDKARRNGTLTETDEKHYLKIKKKYDELVEILDRFRIKLGKLSEEELTVRYNDAMGAILTNRIVNTKTLDLDTEGYKTNRVAVQQAIEQNSNTILKMLNDKKISINSLEPEVRSYFSLEITKNEDGSQSSKYVLKKEVASVRPAPLQKNVSGKKSRSHDTAQIVEVSTRLRHEVKRLKEGLRKQKELAEKIEQSSKRSQKELERKAAKAESQKVTVKDEGLTKTEFTVKPKKKKSTSDTPNYFSVYSTINMPEVLKKLFDVSFDELVNTEVQFTSIDVKTGELYDKEKHKDSDKKFESDLKHEAIGFEAFYEAVRSQLSDLNRQDVLDIVEFFEKGAFTMDGPVNKLMAFEVFILAYIRDAARKGEFHLSDTEQDHLRKLYAYKVSGHASGLQAANQVLEMLDPFHRVRTKMLENYGIDDDSLDPFFKTLQELQEQTDPKMIGKYAEVVAEQLNIIEKEMLAFKLKEAKEMKWSKRWYRNMKSYRFTSMLSSPATWARNLVSNWTLTGVNKASDAVAKMVFALPKKAYREDQWDLTGVEVSGEAKEFIDKYILNNPIFDPLYYSTGKFTAEEKRRLKSQRNLFINLITKALEDHYESAHRFYGKNYIYLDEKDQFKEKGIVDKANHIARFVDKMISDEKFVKRAATKYFGKILTIESQKKKGVNLSKGLSDEVVNLFAEAVIAANQDYMHKRSFVIDTIEKMRDKSPLAYEILTLWQPFINSGFNWFVESLKLTPFGLVNAITRFARLEKQIENVETKRARGEMVPSSRMTEYLIRRDIGKGIVGTLGLILGVLLCVAGRIRLEEDDEKFYLCVGKDGKIKVDISSIFGSSSVLVGASIAQTWVEEDDASIDEMMKYVTSELFNGFIVNDLIERHRYDEGMYDFLLTESESFLKSFVPQFVQIVVRMTNNEKIRYSAGMKGMWERWLNSFVITQPLGARRINPYTGEVETKYALPYFGNFLDSGVLGPKIFWSEIDENERMAREYKVNKNELTGELTINGKKVQLDDVFTLNEKYGKLNAASLREIQSQKHYVEMPDGSFKTLHWDKLSDEQRSNVIQKTMTRNAQIAKIAIWTEAGHKYYAGDSLYTELRRLGITQNVYRGDKGFVE